MLHHDNKVHVTVNGGTDSAIIVDELLLSDLGMKGNELNEQFSSNTVRLKSENRGSDYCIRKHGFYKWDRRTGGRQKKKIF